MGKGTADLAGQRTGLPPGNADCHPIDLSGPSPYTPAAHDPTWDPFGTASPPSLNPLLAGQSDKIIAW